MAAMKDHCSPLFTTPRIIEYTQGQETLGGAYDYLVGVLLACLLAGLR